MSRYAPAAIARLAEERRGKAKTARSLAEMYQQAARIESDPAQARMAARLAEVYSRDEAHELRAAEYIDTARSEVAGDAA